MIKYRGRNDPAMYESQLRFNADPAGIYEQERCRCGHSPNQHRSVRNQYKRPDTDPCDSCSCLSYEEACQ